MSRNCVVCGRPELEKPAIFRNDPWCSDLCRKALLAREAGAFSVNTNGSVR